MIKMVDKKKTYWIGLILCLFFFFVAPSFLPTWATVTQDGVTILCFSLALIIGMALMEDMMLPALMCMTACVIYLNFSIATVATTFVGSTIVLQLVVMWALGYAILKSGAGENITRFILTRKIFQGRSYLMLFALMIAFAVSAIFVINHAMLPIMFSVLGNICAAAGIDKHSKEGKLIYLGPFITISTGIMLPGVMMAMNVTLNGYFEQAIGRVIPPITFTVVVSAAILLFTVLYLLACKFIFKTNLEPLGKVDMAKIVGNDGPAFETDQLLLLGAFVLGALYAFVAPFFPDSGAIGRFKALSISLVIIILEMILSMVKVKGKQVFNPIVSFREGCLWQVALVTAALSFVGGATISPDYGIMDWLMSTLGTFLTNAGIIPVMLICTVVVTIATNFVSNTVVVFLFCGLLAATVAVPLDQAGFNVGVLPPIIMSCGCCAYLTYASAAQGAMFLDEENIDNKFIWTYGVAAMFIWIIAAFIVGMIGVAL